MAVPKNLEHTVLVLPTRIEFSAKHGETVFEAARRNGIEWPTRCLGRGSCRQCYLEVDENPESLSEIARLEKDALKRVLLESVPGFQTRLACQAKVLADVSVRRIGVRVEKKS